MDKFNIGDIVTGTVTGIENYGIFVSLNENNSGLVHISEISDYFVRNINDYVELNEIINVKIIGIDSLKNHLNEFLHLVRGFYHFFQGMQNQRRLYFYILSRKFLHQLF